MKAILMTREKEKMLRKMVGRPFDHPLYFYDCVIVNEIFEVPDTLTMNPLDGITNLYDLVTDGTCADR